MSDITVVGNLVFEPEVKSGTGYNFTKLRVASNDRVKTPEGEWKDGDTTYYDVVAWRRLGDATATLKKGEGVIVVGKIKGRSFERSDGTKGYAYEIEAKSIGKNLTAKDAPARPAPAAVEPDEDSPWE